MGTDPNYDPSASDHVSGVTGLLVANNAGGQPGSTNSAWTVYTVPQPTGMEFFKLHP